MFQAGLAVPETIKMVNTAERALRKLEAQAATRKVGAAQRDALVAELDYLVALRASAAGETQSGVVKAARASVESTLSKDAATQQKSIEAALKALKEGVSTPADDIVAPLFEKAVASAKAAAASKAAASPFASAQQREMFAKRFGYTEDALSDSTLARAKSDKAALAALTGKVGGKVAVGAKYVLKAPITYLK